MSARERIAALLESEAESVTGFAAILTSVRGEHDEREGITARQDIEELLEIAEAAEEPFVRRPPLVTSLSEGITHLAMLAATHEADAELLRRMVESVLGVLDRIEDDIRAERARVEAMSMRTPQEDEENLRLYAMHRRSTAPDLIRDLIEQRRRVRLDSREYLP